MTLRIADLAVALKRQERVAEENANYDCGTAEQARLAEIRHALQEAIVENLDEIVRLAGHIETQRGRWIYVGDEDRAEADRILASDKADEVPAPRPR